MSLKAALSTSGINEITDFRFYPVGTFPGQKCVPDGADANCKMDKLEACMLQSLGGIGGGLNATAQMNLVNFLNCFEGEHGEEKSARTAKTCADKSGIDFTATQACFLDDSQSAKAYQAVTDGAKAGLTGAKCFPWVTLGGQLFSDPASEACVPFNDQAKIVSAICKAFNGTKPAACS